jgi:hypothetical protein
LWRNLLSYGVPGGETSLRALYYVTSLIAFIVVILVLIEAI